MECPKCGSKFAFITDPDNPGKHECSCMACGEVYIATDVPGSDELYGGELNET